MAQAAIGLLSHDVLVSRADELLREWGDCQRREQSLLPQQQNPIATAMRDYGRRTKMDRRQRWANKRNRHKVVVSAGPNGETRTVQALPMAPDRSDRQSRGGAKVADAWPEHVGRVDRVMAQLPTSMLRAVVLYYIGGHSVRSGADALRVSKAEYGKRLDGARWFLVGRLEDVDA